MSSNRGDDAGKGYLKKNIIGMSLTSLFTDVSSESVYAILPFYIRSLGYGREIVGLIEGLGEVFASLFKYLSGFLAEKINKYKGLALLGYSLSSFSKPFFALARTWPFVALVKVVDRIGKGVRTSPRDTLLAASASREYRGRAFGLHRAMDTIGATIGPFMAAVLLPLIGFTGIFLISIIPGLFGVLILYLFVEDILLVKKKASGASSYTRLPGVYWLFLATIILSGLAGYTQAFLLLRASEVGWSEADSIYLLTMANVIYAGLAYPVGYATDVFRDIRLYPLVFLVLVIGAISLAYSTSLIHAVLFFIIFGVYMALHDTLMRIVTGNLVKKLQRARAYGYMHGSYGLSALTGYYIVGYLYQYYGIRTAYMYSTIIGGLGFILAIILVIQTRKNETIT